MPPRHSLFIAATTLALLVNGCGRKPCPTGLVACGPTCIDPMTAPGHCGASADCKGANAGVVCSGDQVCSAGQCKSNNARLSALVLSGAELTPAFTSATNTYTAHLSMCASATTVTATTAEPQTQLIINGGTAVSGTNSARVTFAQGTDLIPVELVAPSGTRSTYTIKVLTKTIYVKASNTDANDRFAVAVALSASGDTMAIGAPGESSNATGVGGNEADDSAYRSGAVYVFIRSGATWTQQAYIKASNAGRDDAFGLSVALSESGDTLAVSAPDEDSTAMGSGGDPFNDGSENSGAVHVFTRSGTTWTQQAYIKASNNDSGDSFGASVALSGDTLAVSAPRESSNATGVGVGTNGQFNNDFQQSGAVYIFTRSGTTWAQQAYVKASNTNAGDAFGSSLTLAGDVLAVGAPLEDSSAAGIGGNQADNGTTDSGAVYIFTRSGASWSQQAYVKASNPDAYDKFGRSVSLTQAGDTLAVGAHQEKSSATGMNGDQADNTLVEAGAVYVFTRSGTSWSQQAYVKASNTGFADNFGSSVSLAPAGDALAVGAPGEASSSTGPGANQADNSASSSGAVYLFERSDETWAQRAYLKASNPGANDSFGSSVALAAGTLLVGARQESSNATGINGTQMNDDAPNSGAAYSFACY